MTPEAFILWLFSAVIAVTMIVAVTDCQKHCIDKGYDCTACKTITK